MNIRAHIDIDATAIAAKNYPTEPYNLRPTGEIRGGKVVRTRPEMVQRRKQDARIFEKMSPAQETAFELINYGWRALASDVMMKSGFNLLRVDGGRRSINPERTAQMANDYLAWAKACPAHDVRVSPILFMIGDGAGVMATARMYRMDNKRVMPNLLAGLELYNMMHINKRKI